MTKRFAFLVPYRFVPPKNGGHKAAFGFAEFLSKKHDVHVISTTNNQTDQAPFKLALLFKDTIAKYINPVVALRCRNYFKQHQINQLILFQPFMGIWMLPIARLLGLTFSIYIQNLEYQRFESLHKWWWRLLYALEWRMYRSADVLYFISPDDREAAIPIFKLNPAKCEVVPYGTPYQLQPSNWKTARSIIIEKHGFQEEDFLIIFFGPQTYAPNLQAVELIINQINPILKDKADFPYRILICGGGLPASYNKLKDYESAGIHYLGFVEDIDLYVSASNVMLNPILTGGGVKTKVIEAIALGKTVVSSTSGALGVNLGATGDKLQVVPDQDYGAYAQALMTLQKSPSSPTPASFYELYYWGNAVSEIA